MHTPIRNFLRWFEFAHLPPGVREFSANFYHFAEIILSETSAGAEQTVALRKLLEAKDAAVRARIDRLAEAPGEVEAAVDPAEPAHCPQVDGLTVGRSYWVRHARGKFEAKVLGLSENGLTAHIEITDGTYEDDASEVDAIAGDEVHARISLGEWELLPSNLTAREIFSREKEGES